MPRTGPSTRLKPSRRTQIVWASFVASMAAVSGLLALGDRSDRHGFLLAARTSAFGADGDRLFRTSAPVDRSRWLSILIHDTGEPAGDAASIRRMHLSFGYQMMGYHFLIGNGNGMADGVVHVGERWIRQLPGWHTIGPQAKTHNEHAVAICMVGNGDRRPFTDAQITQLVSLIRRLQRELGIPASAVRLHRDVAPGLTTSPGRFFPAAEVEQQLLNPVR